MASGKINVTKILKNHMFNAQSGAVYLDFSIWENRDGPGQYGDTHYITQDISKEARDAGERGPIIGNMKSKSANPPQQDAQPNRGISTGGQPSLPADDDSEIPF